MKSKDNKETPKEDVPDYIGHRKRLKARFMSDEGRSMPDYEMLELVLMYAIPRADVKPLAKKLLKHYTCLANVLAAPSRELMMFPGVGENVAGLCTLIHACATKICWENLENSDSPNIVDKTELVEYCRTSIGYCDQEKLLIIYLNTHGEYIAQSIEQAGTISSVLISPREIVKNALIRKAAAIIIAHNHPSDRAAPSKADIDMTRNVGGALKAVGIKLVDHIVITRSSFYSMNEHMPFFSSWS